MSLGPSILLLGASSQFTHLHSTYWKVFVFCTCACVFVFVHLCLFFGICACIFLPVWFYYWQLANFAHYFCPMQISFHKKIWFDFSSRVEIIVGVFLNIVWWMSLALRWCWVEWESMRNAQEHFYMFAFFVFLTNIIFPFSISFLSI